MSSDEITKRLGEVLPQLKNLSAAIRFDLGEDGLWMVDARHAAAARFGRDDGGLDADCTIGISAENLGKLLDGKLDPMLAYTLGKIKVKGSLGIAMKLVSALG